MLPCAISAVATHQIARTSPTDRVNRPNNIANPPPTSTTTAKTQAASTLGRPCLTNIAGVAAGPSNLIVPPMRNKRLSSTRPTSIVALSVPCILRPLIVSVLAQRAQHDTTYPTIFSSYFASGNHRTQRQDPVSRDRRRKLQRPARNGPGRGGTIAAGRRFAMDAPLDEEGFKLLLPPSKAARLLDQEGRQRPDGTPRVAPPGS